MDVVIFSLIIVVDLVVVTIKAIMEVIMEAIKEAMEEAIMEFREFTLLFITRTRALAPSLFLTYKHIELS